MTVRLSIGDFSRMTHLSIKALRHYHDIGLLAPAEIDASSGYRFYAPDQVARAQVIRRFRDLGMPTDEVRALLNAPDVTARNDVIVSHLDRVRAQLTEAQATVDSLRSMLQPGPSTVPVEYRSVPATPALAVTDTVAAAEGTDWLLEALDEIDRCVTASGARAAGPLSALFPGEFYEMEKAELVAFVPLLMPAERGAGRVQTFEVPATELAVALHVGAFSDIDVTYGQLGIHVASNAIGVDGPIREHYLRTIRDTPDETQHRIEVGWPIFQTALPD